jgi:RNA polymerase sigma factor (sigma-70 family)
LGLTKLVTSTSSTPVFESRRTSSAFSAVGITPGSFCSPSRTGATSVMRTVRIVRKIGSLRDPARFGAWATRIVTNTCRDAQRTRRTSARTGAEIDAASPDGGAGDAGDDVDRLRSALRRLPGEQRALLSLRYTERLGLAEIARALGVPVGTVKSRLHAVRAELRRVLEDDG